MPRFLSRSLSALRTCRNRWSRVCRPGGGLQSKFTVRRMVCVSRREFSWYRDKNPLTREPFRPSPGGAPTECSPEEAVAIIKSNQRVFVHGAASTPSILLNALAQHARANDLKKVELVHIHTDGMAPQVAPEFQKHFRDNSFFIGGNVRKAVNDGIADFTPIFLSEIPGLFESPEYEIDCAMLSLSPPDRHGFCSLGPSVDCSRAAMIAAKRLIGVVNSRIPRTHGDGHVHISHFDRLCYHDSELPEKKPATLDTLDPASDSIGRIIAEQLIPDRACLQVGIGSIPDATLLNLGNHNDLGIHTEMFSDGVLPLVDKGIVTNKYKFEHPGKIVSSFCMGSRKLYDFIDDNPYVVMTDCSYSNDTHVIRSNKLVHAINSCIEVDITGQVCSDSIGTRMYSGIGGQMDFMRGAALSPGGKAIMAMPSTTSRGESKIVPHLKMGAGVVTTRAHIQYMVTEYGYARLYGKSLRERAKLLIGLAHPDHRESLEKAAVERFGQLELNDSIDIDHPVGAEGW